MPKSILAALIMSLGNLSYMGAWLLIVRSVYKIYKENDNKEASFQISKIPDIVVASHEDIKEEENPALKVNEKTNKTSYSKLKNASISLKDINMHISECTDHKNFTEMSQTKVS